MTAHTNHPASQPPTELATAAPAADDDAAEAEPAHGGAREGSGRKRKGKRKKAGHAVYAYMQLGEKREVERRAKAAGLTVSKYLRKVLGFRPMV